MFQLWLSCDQHDSMTHVFSLEQRRLYRMQPPTKCMHNPARPASSVAWCGGSVPWAAWLLAASRCWT